MHSEVFFYVLGFDFTSVIIHMGDCGYRDETFMIQLCNTFAFKLWRDFYRLMIDIRCVEDITYSEVYLKMSQWYVIVDRDGIGVSCSSIYVLFVVYCSCSSCVTTVNIVGQSVLEDDYYDTETSVRFSHSRTDYYSGEREEG